jgi:hypothetical protein
LGVSDGTVLDALKRKVRAAALRYRCLSGGLLLPLAASNRAQRGFFDPVGYCRHQQAHEPPLDTPEKGRLETPLMISFLNGIY